jgi:hypothetical protein
MKTIIFSVMMLLGTQLSAERYSCMLSHSNTSYAYHVTAATYYELHGGKQFNSLVISYATAEYRTGQLFAGSGELAGGLERYSAVHMDASAWFGTHSASDSIRLILEYPGERSVYNCEVIVQHP